MTARSRSPRPAATESMWTSHPISLSSSPRATSVWSAWSTRNPGITWPSRGSCPIRCAASWFTLVVFPRPPNSWRCRPSSPSANESAVSAGHRSPAGGISAPSPVSALLGCSTVSSSPPGAQFFKGGPTVRCHTDPTTTCRCAAGSDRSHRSVNAAFRRWLHP